MKLDDSAAKQLRIRATRSDRTRAECLSADVLARAADGTLGRVERGAVADHLSSCADCAEELQLLAPLGAFAERTAVALGRAPAEAANEWAIPVWQYATAAVLVVAVGAMAVWNAALQRENRELTTRAAISERPVETAPPTISNPSPVTAPAPRASAPPDVVALAQPHVNVPIIDLQPDALRGGASPGAIATVAADADLVTLILNTDSRDASGSFTLTVTAGGGRSIWRSEALAITPFNNFTIALSPRALGAGTYRLELSRGTGDRLTPLETYTLRVEPRGQ